MTDLEDRARPEALLEKADRERHGKLKIFLGAFPGVGKTYAMLQAAQAHLGEGVDVVVGVVETHGRVETEALLRGLEIVPCHQISYRSRYFVTHRQILREVRGPAHEDDVHYLRIYIGHLRQKLGDDSANPQFIESEPGIGYRLIVHEA